MKAMSINTRQNNYYLIGDMFNNECRGWTSTIILLNCNDNNWLVIILHMDVLLLTHSIYGWSCHLRFHVNYARCCLCVL